MNFSEAPDEESEADFDDYAEDPSIGEDMRTLVSDVRAFASAELAYQKARAVYSASAGRSVALFGVIAAVLLFFALMAVVVGTIIALVPHIGAWAAMAVVTIVLLLAAVAAALVARAKAARMKAVLSRENAHA